MLTYKKTTLTIIFVALGLFFNGTTRAHAANIFSDSFSGTSINSTKWSVVDPTGTSVTQNNGLFINNGSLSAGYTALISRASLPSSGLSISAAMTRGTFNGGATGSGDLLLGYGDSNYTTAGTKAYVIYNVGSNGTIFALAYNNGGILNQNLNCGTVVDGATYKLTVTGTGFSVYKNTGGGDVLQCTITTAVVVANKPAFMESFSNTSSGEFNTFSADTTNATPTAFSLSGPTAGFTNVASDVFSVTPNAPYTGTITLTPSGGGLTTPVVLTFNNSVATQTFTATATMTGTVTFTPTNNGSLTNPSALSYSVSNPSAPGIPTGVSAVPSNGQITVSFNPAAANGSPVTSYTVTATSTANTVSLSGMASPIVLTGLVNGFSYTVTVTATNSIGTSSPSAGIMITPGTVNTFTDTFTGTAGTLLENHTSDSGGIYTNVSTTSDSLVINNLNQIRPNTTGVADYIPLNSPAVLNYSVQADLVVKSIVPEGIYSITARSDANATHQYIARYNAYSGDPPSWELYVHNGGANYTRLGKLTATLVTGQTYTLKLSVNGSSIQVFVNGGLIFNVTDTTLTSAGYSGIEMGYQGLGATPSDTTGIAMDNFTFQTASLASGYTLTGPSFGYVNNSPATFTVTPNGVYTGTVTVTPSGGGLSTPTVLTFNNSPTAQTFTIAPTMTGTVTLTPTNNGLLPNAPPLSYSVMPSSGTIAVNDPGLFYSPYNWYISGSNYAISQTPGAYIKTNFTGTAVTLNFSENLLTTAGTNPTYYPRIRYQVDGGNTTDVQLTPTTTSIVAATGLAPGTHTLLIVYPGDGGGTVSDPDRWQVPVQAVEFTGLTIDGGASVSLPTLRPKRMLIYGDSITEGVRANGISAISPNGDQDATEAVPWLLAGTLNAEVGFRALGGGGWTVPGSGGVPPVYTPGNDTNSMWDKYSAGKSLLNSSGVFSQAPDYIYINEGTNDSWNASDAAVIASIDGWLPAVRLAAPNAYIFLVVPFGQFKASAITSAYNTYVAANPSDKKVFLIDLGAAAAQGINATSQSTPQASDGLHPYAATDVTLAAQMAPLLAGDILPDAPTNVVATPGNNQATISFTPSISNGGAPVSSYTVTATPGNITVTGTSPSIVITGLKSGTEYTFTVFATSTVGNSDTVSVAAAIQNPNVQGYVSGGTPIAPVISSSSSGNDVWLFTRNLAFGNKNSEVQLLQRYLNTHGFLVATKGAGSAGHETTTFGSATKAAVIRFQKAKGIIPTSGYFGPLTRTWINKH